MTRLLIVSSPTSTPLSTPVTIDTDGQPEWASCAACSGRFLLRDRPQCHRRAVGRQCVYDPNATDGPYPFPAARWEEVEGEYVCAGPASPQTFHREWSDACPECGPEPPAKIGAITELVEITGPSHHAGECESCPPSDDGHPCYGPSSEHFCHPDALPDCWHTPTGTVTRLAAPYPCERPRRCLISDCYCTRCIGMSFWREDIDMEVPT